MNYFKNKTVWITGASFGIGEELVYTLSNLNIAEATELSIEEVEILRRQENHF